MRFARLFLALALLCCLKGTSLFGQSTFATITGVVQDPTGAVVVGASVEATQIQRNFKYTAVSNEAGQYTLANVLEGTYTVVVKATGFQDFKADNVVLSARDVRRVDANLSLATSTATVEVSAGATLIETESARIVDSRSREVMRALPLTLRRAWDFFTLTPQFERTNGWNLRLAGAGELQSEATMDGTTISQAWGAPMGPMMDRTELVQEMRVDIAQANAESATMGNLALISRSGSNELHGNAALYYSNNDLNSRDPFRLTKNKGWGYQWILGVGGPVYVPKIYNGKNRTFFFWNLEIATGPVSPFTVQRVVPLNRWRQGDFSTYTAAVLKDPLNNNAPFAGNRIPSSRINSTAKTYQDMLMPDQNTNSLDVLTPGSPTYLKTFSGFPFVHQPTMSERIDHRISDKQFMFARWTSVRWNFNQPETAFRELTPKRLNTRNMDTVTGAHTYTFRPTLLNEFRYGLSTQRYPQTSAWKGYDVVKQLGFVGLAPGIGEINGLPRVTFEKSGVASVNSPQECDPCDQHYVQTFTDNVSWFRGKHDMKMGWTGVRSRQQQLQQSTALYGDFRYSGNFTGLDYADFLLGIPTTMSRAFPALAVNRTRWNHGFFFQDSFRPDPRVTLTLGIRWDAALPWTEDDNHLAVFDEKTSKIVVPDSALSMVSKLMPTGFIDVIGATAAGYPKSLVRSDLNNWQPRFGIAYRPWGNNTVFRGGFGMAYNTAPSGVSTGAVVPYIINENAYTNPADNPLMWPLVFPSSGGAGPSSVSIPGSLVADIQVPRVIQYSFAIEHQRWDTGFMIAYNGNGTRGNTYTRQINRPIADTNLYINKPRPFPKYSDIGRTENGAGHQYNALTVQATRKTKGGLYYQSYFVWANDMSDEVSPEDPMNRLREKARHERQAKLRYSANAVYELPVGHGRKFLGNSHWLVNGLFGGWRLSSIVALETGRPLNVSWYGPDPTGTRYTGSSTRPNVTIRPDVLGDFTVDNPNQYLWFDKTKFAAPQLGQYGNAGRGILIGPGTSVLHNSIAKEFPIKERARIRFEVLARNTLNHPNWGNPNTTITDAAAGGIYSVIDLNSKFDAATPREVQLHMRIEW